MTGLVSLYKGAPEGLLLIHMHQRKAIQTEQEGRCLKARKRVFTRI